MYDCRHACETGTWEEQNAAGYHGDNFGNQHEGRVCVSEGVYAPGELQPRGEAVRCVPETARRYSCRQARGV